MKFGGLSEKEIIEISALLEAENISYDITSDQDMMNTNAQSMKYDLRHLSSPSISTHVLTIIFDDDAFTKMSTDTKSKLLDLGITDQIPDELEFKSNSTDVEPIQQEILWGNKRITGVSFTHLIFFSLLTFAVNYIYENYF